MNFESLLNRFTHNVESIIQWLFLFILALSGFLISRWLLIKKSDGGEAAASAGGPSPEISGVLQQILERTAKLDGANVQPLSPEQVALASTQVDSLKKELSAREDELKALKAAGSGTTEETSKLANRLKELEAKLAEYEILEDDIADLSLYKEENVRLRAELDKLKNGGAAPATEAPAVNEADVAAAIAAAAGAEPAPEAAPAAAASATPAPATEAPSSPDADIVAEFAQAVGAESAPLPEMTMEVPDTGDPMKDFEAAVQIEQQLKAKPAATGEAASAAAASPATTTASTAPTAADANTPGAAASAGAPASAAAPAPAVAAAQAEADDLFAEFAESPKSEDAAPGALDTDKMMAEMAALVGIEPSSGSSLEEGIDIDKMAAEAAKR